MSALLGIGLFVIGVLLAVWATERLLEGLVGLSVAFRLSAFAVGAVLSGFEVENVAVGLAAGARGTAPVALGTVFGGAIFLVCVALGVGAVLFPLEIRLPLQTTQSSKSQPESKAEATGAAPLVAAGCLAGIVNMWVEALFRLLFTNNANFDAAYVLWQARVGDIAAMWLTMWVVSLMVFFVFGFLIFRCRARVGSIWFWTILLIISAIVAPLIGEIGTPIGI